MMAEDEQKKTQDEGAATAGPDAAEDASDLTRSDTSSSAPPADEASGSETEEGPTPAPPADEASEDKDEASAEEPAATEEKAEGPEAEEEKAEGPEAGEEKAGEPEAEEEKAEEPGAEEGKAGEPEAEEKKAEAEPDPEDELPWKERRRLQRSRQPHGPRPQRSAGERKAERLEARKRKAALRRKQRDAARDEKGKAGTGTPPAERAANPAKVRQGVVVSDGAEKSITVRIDIVRRHPTYEKVVRSTRTLHVHDERNEAGEGDVVQVVETRPLSKTKRWRLVEVLERAK
jgi:small subunit ribosomal protein S17